MLNFGVVRLFYKIECYYICGCSGGLVVINEIVDVSIGIGKVILFRGGCGDDSG